MNKIYQNISLSILFCVFLAPKLAAMESSSSSTNKIIPAARVMKAALVGSLEEVKKCVEQDPACINYQSGEHTALSVAALNGKLNVVQYLVEKGATRPIALTEQVRDLMVDDAVITKLSPVYAYLYRLDNPATTQEMVPGNSSFLTLKSAVIALGVTLMGGLVYYFSSPSQEQKEQE